jgi:hypothetical protein
MRPKPKFTMNSCWVDPRTDMSYRVVRPGDSHVVFRARAHHSKGRYLNQEARVPPDVLARLIPRATFVEGLK